MTRDQQIFDEVKKNHFSNYKMIAAKFGLSQRRIKYICEKESLNERIRELQTDLRRIRSKYYQEILKKSDSPI